jgi:thiamine transport system ATP-binding protein
LLSLIAGFETPVQGSIHIDGKDVTHMRPSDRPVTTMFQENNLFAHLTVAANVGLGRHPGLRLSRADRRAVGEALDAVGLSGYDSRLPSELSGGERQRAALARCLCHGRPVLLLDEPFAALDPALRGEMRSLVNGLRRERDLTVIMVSHHPEEVTAIADRGLFLHGGEVLAVGPLKEMLSAALPQELRDYLGAES